MSKNTITIEFFTGTEPGNNVPIFPGYWRDELEPTRGVGFYSSQFRSYAEYKAFFDRVTWKVSSICIETSNDLNFSFELILQSRAVANKESKSWVRSLRGYRIVSSFDPLRHLPSINIPGSHLKYTTAPFAEMSLSAIASNSWVKITIEFIQ